MSKDDKETKSDSLLARTIPLPGREAEEVERKLRGGMDMFRDRMRTRSGTRQHRKSASWIEDALGEFMLDRGLRRALRSTADEEE